MTLMEKVRLAKRLVEEIQNEAAEVRGTNPLEYFYAQRIFYAVSGVSVRLSDAVQYADERDERMGVAP